MWYMDAICDTAENVKSKSTTLEEIPNERTKLEEFLSNESNKINKNAIKFVLSKWMLLERKLQEEIIEREKLTVAYQDLQETSRFFAQVVVSVPRAGPVLPATKEKKMDYKVVLIKPLKEDDTK